MRLTSTTGHLVDLNDQDHREVREFLGQVLAAEAIWKNHTLPASVHFVAKEHRNANPGGTSLSVVNVALKALLRAVGAGDQVSLETFETEVRALTREQRRSAIEVAMELVTAASVNLGERS